MVAHIVILCGAWSNQFCKKPIQAFSARRMVPGKHYFDKSHMVERHEGKLNRCKCFVNPAFLGDICYYFDTRFVMSVVRLLIWVAFRAKIDQIVL